MKTVTTTTLRGTVMVHVAAQDQPVITYLRSKNSSVCARRVPRLPIPSAQTFMICFQVEMINSMCGLFSEVLTSRVPKALRPIPSTTQVRYGNIHLWSRHSRGESRRLDSSKPSLAILAMWGQPVEMKLSPPKKVKINKIWKHVPETIGKKVRGSEMSQAYKTALPALNV